MTLDEILPKLCKKFPPELHRQRDLPGGAKWWFLPWQTIRERFDEVCPGLWEVSYSTPTYVGDFCTITCTIAILGISRQGIGSAEVSLISKSGRDMSRGNPIERATADAFKNAAEAWGVARYLDEQADDRTKQAFIRYMADRGDLRPAQEYKRQNGQVAPARRSDPASKPFGQSSVSPARSTASNTPTLITENERQDLWTIAQSTGYDAPAFKCLVEACGFKSSATITKAALPEILDRAKDVESLRIYQEAAKVAG